MDIGAALEKRFSDILGINPSVIGRAAVERIVTQALRRTGTADAAGYLSLLARSPEEAERCLEALVVPETWFFRDREPFELLRQHLCQHWFPANPGRKVRILCLPCSTGEEPYSIAITLLGAGISPEQFHLDAADISRRALAAARRAEYGKGSFREPLTPGQALFFRATGRSQRVADEVVSNVHYRRANIIDPDLLAGCDPYQIIFCRNVLIYLTDGARARALENIGRLLAADGLLFSGHAEMGIFQQQGYTAVRHPRAFACRRTGPQPRGGGKGFLTASPGAGPTLRASVPPPAAASSPAPAKRHRQHSGPGEGVSPEAAADPAGSKSAGDGPRDGTAAGAAGALHAEALALADRGRFDDAETLCRRHLREQRPHADVYALLGLIQEAAGRPEEAEEQYLKALYLDPDHYETLVHLSLLYRQRGEVRKASLLNRRAAAAQRRPHEPLSP